MLKKVSTVAVALATVGSLALSASAQAGEGRTSIGHGVKCFYYLGELYCFRGVRSHDGNRP